MCQFRADLLRKNFWIYRIHVFYVVFNENSDCGFRNICNSYLQIICPYLDTSASMIQAALSQWSVDNDLDSPLHDDLNMMPEFTFGLVHCRQCVRIKGVTTDLNHFELSRTHFELSRTHFLINENHYKSAEFLWVLMVFSNYFTLTLILNSCYLDLGIFRLFETQLNSENSRNS